MANVLFDIDVGMPWIYPYVGGGVGYAWTNLSRSAVFTANQLPAAPRPVDETKGSFAFQAIGGLSFPIPGVPGLSLTAEYRFFGIPGSENFAGNQVVADVPAALPVTLKVAAPVQPQLPARRALCLQRGRARCRHRRRPRLRLPLPARSYLVFFDWDKATLTDRARQIVKEAADNSTRVQYTRIEVNGYTDTSGTHSVQPGPVAAPRPVRCRPN